MIRLTVLKLDNRRRTKEKKSYEATAIFPLNSKIETNCTHSSYPYLMFQIGGGGGLVYVTKRQGVWEVLKMYSFDSNIQVLRM